MLKLVSEEFISPKEDLRLVRREELKNGLTERIPVIFQLLHSVIAPFAEIVKVSSPSASFDAYKVSIARSVEALQVRRLPAFEPFVGKVSMVVA